MTATQGRGSNGVRAVDNFDGNQRLGLVFETKAVKGKPFVRAKDLLGHLGSKDFDPKAGPDMMATSVSSKKG